MGLLKKQFSKFCGARFSKSVRIPETLHCIQPDTAIVDVQLAGIILTLLIFCDVLAEV